MHCMSYFPLRWRPPPPISTTTLRIPCGTMGTHLGYHYIYGSIIHYHYHRECIQYTTTVQHIQHQDTIHTPLHTMCQQVLPPLHPCYHQYNTMHSQHMQHQNTQYMHHSITTTRRTYTTYTLLRVPHTYGTMGQHIAYTACIQYHHSILMDTQHPHTGDNTPLLGIEYQY